MTTTTETSFSIFLIPSHVAILKHFNRYDIFLNIRDVGFIVLLSKQLLRKCKYIRERYYFFCKQSINSAWILLISNNHQSFKFKTGQKPTSLIFSPLKYIETSFDTYFVYFGFVLQYVKLRSSPWKLVL